jgi:hypothetical protein
MKFKYIILAFMSIALFSCQQAISQAPEAVQKTFEQKYPGENDPDWHLDAHGNYESHFKIDGVKHRADFKPNGMWIETEISIKKKDLPKPILKVINEKYGDRKITEVEKVYHHSKGLFYDVEFKRKGKNMDVEFKADGSILYVDK